MNTAQLNGHAVTSNAVEGRTGNTLLELVGFAVENDVENTPEAQAAHAQLEALTKKVHAAYGYTLAREIEDAAQTLRGAYSLAMFDAGWRLRGNPDELRDLVEAN